MTTEKFPTFPSDFLRYSFEVAHCFTSLTYKRELMISTTVTHPYQHLSRHRKSQRGGEELTSRLQASATNQETINIILLGQVTAVLLANATTVDDAGVVSDFGGDGLTEPLANSGVDFLRLSGCGDLAGSDGPAEDTNVRFIPWPREKGGRTR